MSNGDAQRLPEDGAPGEMEAPIRARKTRAMKKKTTKKRTAKTAVAKTPAKNAVAKSTAKSTTTKPSKRTTSGYTRVQVGNSEMFVSREMAGALTNKDLKRLRAVFKRVSKRARKRAAKQKP
jgi:hypothetical protein